MRGYGHRPALILLALLVAVPARLEPSEAEASAVLARFVGVWRTEAVIRRGPACGAEPPGRAGSGAGSTPACERRTTGRAAGRFVVAGRVVEFRTTSIEPPGVAELQVMTYDPDAGTFRQWVSDSDGYRHETVGRWDPATATLRWEGQIDGETIVIEDRWVSRDRLEWALVRSGADGRVLQTIEGVVSR